MLKYNRIGISAWQIVTKRNISKTLTCSVCGYTQTENMGVLPNIPHSKWMQTVLVRTEKMHCNVIAWFSDIRNREESWKSHITTNVIITISLHGYISGTGLQMGAEGGLSGTKSLSRLTLTSANDRCSRAIYASGSKQHCGQCAEELRRRRRNFKEYQMQNQAKKHYFTICLSVLLIIRHLFI